MLQNGELVINWFSYGYRRGKSAVFRMVFKFFGLSANGDASTSR
jgi:hypothetical protein